VATNLTIVTQYFFNISYLILLNISSYGQAHYFKPIDLNEENLFNELTSTFKNEENSIILSPFIVSPDFFSDIDIYKLVKKYGFVKKQFKRLNTDTLLLVKNEFIQIINLDSLIKYQNIPKDTAMLFRDPIVFNIEEKYNKNTICFLKKCIFSTNTEYAVVQFHFYCGFLCASGKTVLMHRINNKWIILETLVEWIS
jgi:hypothetical protein